MVDGMISQNVIMKCPKCQVKNQSKNVFVYIYLIRIYSSVYRHWSRKMEDVTIYCAPNVSSNSTGLDSNCYKTYLFLYVV